MTYWWLSISTLFILSGLKIALWGTLLTSKASAATNSKDLSFSKILLSILLVLTGVVFGIFTFWSSDVFLSESSWYERSPYRELMILGLMMMGMASRILSVAIEERKAKISNLRPEEKRPGIQLDKWDFIYPLLSSIICFGVILEAVGDQILTLTTIMLSFQNGFFWQTVINTVKPTK